jgi:hypothetical protein
MMSQTQVVKPTWPLTFLLAICLFTPSEAEAQSCYLRPSAECSSIWLSEFRVSRYLTGPESVRRAHYMTSHIGYLASLRGASAIGGALFIGNHDGLFAGVQVRYRRWLGPTKSLNVGLGVSPISEVFQGTPVFAELGLNVRDYVGVVLGLQTVREEAGVCTVAPCSEPPQGGKRIASTVGLQLGSVPGTVVSALYYVLGVLAMWGSF